jgi:hypothetical protein
MFLLALLLTSAPVGQSSTSGDYQAAYDQAFQTAYDKAFRSSFRIRSIEQCPVSAKYAATANIDVAPICACVTDRLLATKSVDELKTQPTASELRLLTAECIAANPPARKSGKP